MGALVVAIVLVGSLLILASLAAELLSRRKLSSTSSNQNHIDQVREAAFAVIEASLEAEPQDWKVVANKSNNKRTAWLTNASAGLALWMNDGPTGLFVLRRKSLDKKFTLTNGDVIEPPTMIKHSLFTAASRIVSGANEKKEVEQLKKMVATFGHIVDRSNAHDAKAA